MDFDSRLKALDTSLFAAIPSQSSPADRASWLALQAAVRSAKAPYTYLEIGSHLGGSIQQHLLDPRCGHIYSIDKRSPEQPDDRGPTFRYENNTTARMLENLRALDPKAISRITCLDGDANQLEPAQIDTPPDFCFIDGEHTREAVLSDFAFCLRVAAAESVIAFHDDWIVYPALAQICRDLEGQRRIFGALKLRGATFALCLGGHPAGLDARVRSCLCRPRCWGLWYLRLHHLVERRFPSSMRPWLRAIGRKLLYSRKPERS